MANSPDNQDDKKHMAASDSMREFLNMGSKEGELSPSIDLSANSDSKSVEAQQIGELPPDLPFLDTLEEPGEDSEAPSQTSPNTPPSPAGPVEQILGPAADKGNEGYAFVLWLVKSIAPYVVIFAIGLGLYFFYFSDFSFTSVFKTNSITLEKVTSSSNKDLEKLKSDQKEEYLKWMSQFFFAVNDDAIISMDADVSGNGLSNFEKYLLDLNPKVYSTRGTSKPDGELVAEGINPWTGKPFTDKQKELVDKYISKELVSNRITAAALNRGVTKFAQYVNEDSPYYIDPNTLKETANNPANETQNNEIAHNAAQQANSPSAGNINPGSDINQSIPGHLDIPANNISVPLIWTKDVKDFDKDLKNGVVHYPGTALPGQLGTSYISGHSSGYLWDKSAYKEVFAILGNVTDGTSFTITATLNNGQKVRYDYVVTGRGEFAANDQAQFVNTADSMVALSTCWPVGTTARRLVLFAKLVQTSQ